MKKALILAILCTVSFAKSGGHATSHVSRSTHSSSSQHTRIHRSAAAVNAFKKSNPCPANGRTSGPCRGFTVDHRKALACGGADAPSNMQWQTKSDALAKDKWERIGCK